jgi:hypothetical protein
MKDLLNKDMESLQKESNRSPGNKMLLKSSKNYSRKLLQGTGTRGRWKFRLKDKIDIKEKNRKILTENTEVLLKEYGSIP